MRAGAQLVQQHRDEVQARLDGHHHARLQRPRQAQVAMAFGLGRHAAGLAGHEAAHVVHLQAEQMPDAMREEGLGHALGHHGLFAHVHQARLAQHAGHAAVGAEVDVAVVHPLAHLVDQRQLLALHRGDQRSELVMACSHPGAGDVAGITIHLRASVDQEAARLGRRLLVLVLVVQHRGMLVQADDVGVGQVAVGVAGGQQIGAVDARLALATQEGGLCSEVARHGTALRGAHLLQLVGALHASRPVQPVEQGLGVVGREARQRCIGLAEDGGARRDQVGQGLGRLFGLADDHQFHRIHPLATGLAWRHMPVVVRLVVDDARLQARAHGQPAVRMLGQRQPVLEMRVGLEEVGPIIEEGKLLDAGRDQHRVKPGGGERGFGLALQRGKVVAVEAHRSITHLRT
mmetsp:Transcript_5755/g.22305  ORF Transcript_5755/g.22305 Transcript_5755/m.22305 type:complete len:403 (-) Transcript_5755:4639-5847(-)